MKKNKNYRYFFIVSSSFIGFCESVLSYISLYFLPLLLTSCLIAYCVSNKRPDSTYSDEYIQRLKYDVGYSIFYIIINILIYLIFFSIYPSCDTYIIYIEYIFVILLLMLAIVIIYYVIVNYIRFLYARNKDGSNIE